MGNYEFMRKERGTKKINSNVVKILVSKEITKAFNLHEILMLFIILINVIGRVRDL